MTILQSIIIGIVQGITEFLPISSSGHVILAQNIMGVTPSLGVLLTMHIATLCAIVVAMRKEIIPLIKKPFQKVTLSLFIACLGTGITVFLMGDAIDLFFDGEFLAPFFLLTAILLFSSSEVTCQPRELTPLDCFIIGLSQGIAVIPGLSRSGTTIAVGSMLSGNEKESTSFSFLLSIPVIIISFVADLLGGGSMGIDFIPLLCGFAAAFFSGLICVKFMLKHFSGSKRFFSFYLVLLSLLLTCNDLFLHLF